MRERESGEGALKTDDLSKEREEGSQRDGKKTKRREREWSLTCIFLRMTSKGYVMVCDVPPAAAPQASFVRAIRVSL